ncbi:MAG: hypothetical protein H8E31_15520, partial [Planctomycetes bacterium]|nr:hypothetical protein [Planctomycetota bacterium]
KFKDADLIGVPLRVVVGGDAGERQVEWSLRASGDKEVVGAGEAVERVVALVAEAGA